MFNVEQPSLIPLFQLGVSTCTLFYIYDSSTAEVPSFTNVPKFVKVRRHKTLEIAIKVHGFPLPKQVTWFKDGEPLLKSREIILQYLDGDSTLLIHDTGPLNSGLYECYAENEYGNTICRIPVQILQVRLNFKDMHASYMNYYHRFI